MTPLLAWAISLQVRAAGPVERGLHPLPATVRAQPSFVGLAFLGFGGRYTPPARRGVGLLTPRRVGRSRRSWSASRSPPGSRSGRTTRKGSRPAYAFASLAALELLALAIHSGDVTASAAGTAAYVAFWVLSLALGAAGVWFSSASAERAAAGSR